jgi:hypothetical protein
MIISGKIKLIQKTDPVKDIYTVVLSKTRKNKKILVPVTFWGHLSSLVPKLLIGTCYDIQFYTYGKEAINKGKAFWNTYLVAEKIRIHAKGNKNYKEIVNKDTGEVIKQKGKF